MTISLGLLSRNAILNTLISLIDGGSQLNYGYIEIRTGPRPTNVDAAPTGTLLVTCDLSNPSFQPVTNGQTLAYDITPRSTILADGTATWFRIYSRDNLAVLDGDISDAEGDGDIKFNIADFTQEGKIAVATFRISAPAIC